MSVENSGGKCSYYTVIVKHPWNPDEQEYSAECGELIEALGLTVFEANIFKEIWRTAAARKGMRKKGNNSKRAAEKILFFANRIMIEETRNVRD